MVITGTTAAMVITGITGIMERIKNIINVIGGGLSNPNIIIPAARMKWAVKMQLRTIFRMIRQAINPDQRYGKFVKTPGSGRADCQNGAGYFFIINKLLKNIQK